MILGVDDGPLTVRCSFVDVCAQGMKQFDGVDATTFRGSVHRSVAVVVLGVNTRSGADQRVNHLMVSNPRSSRESSPPFRGCVQIRAKSNEPVNLGDIVELRGSE